MIKPRITPVFSSPAPHEDKDAALSEGIPLSGFNN